MTPLLWISLILGGFSVALMFISVQLPDSWMFGGGQTLMPEGKDLVLRCRGLRRHRFTYWAIGLALAGVGLDCLLFIPVMVGFSEPHGSDDWGWRIFAWGMVALVLLCGLLSLAVGAAFMHHSRFLAPLREARFVRSPGAPTIGIIDHGIFSRPRARTWPLADLTALRVLHQERRDALFPTPALGIVLPMMKIREPLVSLLLVFRDGTSIDLVGRVADSPGARKMLAMLENWCAISAAPVRGAPITPWDLFRHR